MEFLFNFFTVFNILMYFKLLDLMLDLLRCLWLLSIDKTKLLIIIAVYT